MKTYTSKLPKKQSLHKTRIVCLSSESKKLYSLHKGFNTVPENQAGAKLVSSPFKINAQNVDLSTFYKTSYGGY